VRDGVPSFDATTWSRWESLEFRVLLDGFALPGSTAVLDGSTAGAATLRGGAVARLAPGGHAAALQWRALRSSGAGAAAAARPTSADWALVRGGLDAMASSLSVGGSGSSGSGGGGLFSASISVENRAPRALVPVAGPGFDGGAGLDETAGQPDMGALAWEDVTLPLTGFAVEDADAALEPELEVVVALRVLALPPVDLEVAGTPAGAAAVAPVRVPRTRLGGAGTLAPPGCLSLGWAVNASAARSARAVLDGGRSDSGEVGASGWLAESAAFAADADVADPAILAAAAAEGFTVLSAVDDATAVAASDAAALAAALTCVSSLALQGPIREVNAALARLR
jgi:hypothetical protein